MTSRSRPPASGEAARAAGWLGPWLAAGALGLWSADPAGPLLAIAAGGVMAAAVWGVPHSRASAVGLVLLVSGILAGFGAHRQVASVTRDWPAYWSVREERIDDLLADRLERRLQDAEAAADGLAQAVAQGVGAPQEAVVDLRRRTGVTALALYGPAGELRAWDGTHRGRVSEEVQRGLRRYAYGDLPLFGYVYVTSPAGGAGTAVAAILLTTDLPDQLAADAGDFASAFRAESGEEIRLVRRGAQDESGGGWDFRLGNRVLFTVVLEPPTVEARVDELYGVWRLLVAGITVLSWLLLAVGAAARPGAGAAAGGVLMLLAAVLPLGEIDALSAFFAPLAGGPLGLSLGRVAAIAAAGAILVPMAARRRPWLPAWVAGLIAAILVPVLLAGVGGRVSAHALSDREATWVLFQAAAATLLALALGGVLALVRTRASGRGPLWGAAAAALLLGAASGVWVWVNGAVPPWWPALWGGPAYLAARALPEGGEPWHRGAVWALAAVISASAVVPSAWAYRVQARMEVAADHLRRLASPTDPEVEAALRLLGQRARRHAAEGVRGVELLYAAWHESGLAELGKPAWLTTWSARGIPEEELRVGMNELPTVARTVQQDTSAGIPVRLYRFDRDDARYVLRASLPGDEVLTATVPPFADPAARLPLSPLLAGRSPVEEPLTLIAVGQGEELEPPGVRWVRTGQGWQGEHRLVFQNDVRYHAHYAVRLPGVPLTLARGTLLLLLDLVVVLVLVAGGWALRRETLPRALSWSGLVLPFRARVTLALFGFFVLANAIFGTLAYRTIAGTSHRAAQVLAERVVDDASGWYFEVGGRMQALARRVGVELLEYRDGELREGSVEELVELGLYDAWIPQRVHVILDGRESVKAFTEGALGPWEYVTAFRRLPDGDVLAAQVPLQAGATAIRSADVAELLGFAVVLGAALSFGLALLVGRALTRPIHALQVASERVGAGNLGLRLPDERADEFGAVFRAFNRMVARLRRARRQLVRTSRRTQAIMEEAAVGMVALDPSGRIMLVNPRAVGLLEARLVVGEPLPSDGPAGGELRGWLEGFLSGDAREGGVELVSGARRIRVRARRLGPGVGDGGAVVALEDVTDELRTERVLAWGEMARQVAHEVKNPLTPIKLSVQHVRRAWEDGSPDFGAILVRNADAMLAEIDRLAAIAKSFSRFGAPSGEEGMPLAAVDVARVVTDILALYGASPAGVRFDHDVEPDLPPVRARVAEMKEVLVNLLENARAAARDGGQVRVEAFAGADGEVVLRVTDDGSGIPPELMGKVFEPHFSSRTTGTGLGLAIVRRLVESWGGEVELGSEPGRGTTVTIRLLPWGTPEGGGSVAPTDRAS